MPAACYSWLANVHDLAKSSEPRGRDPARGGELRGAPGGFKGLGAPPGDSRALDPK